MLGCFFSLLNTLGAVLFPLVGFYAIDNGNIIALIIICSLYSIYYIIANNLIRGEFLRVIVLLITTFLSVRTYEVFNPFIVALIEFPLIDLGVTILLIVWRFNHWYNS